ncbi:unnamed protein product [Amoebophrya sp. A120]|nr:unnamed protein product [Amoebophrya sp. A120]|eukprot:GSA120T00003214001.1
MARPFWRMLLYHALALCIYFSAGGDAGETHSVTEERTPAQFTSTFRPQATARVPASSAAAPRTVPSSRKAEDSSTTKEAIARAQEPLGVDVNEEEAPAQEHQQRQHLRAPPSSTSTSSPAGTTPSSAPPPPPNKNIRLKSFAGLHPHMHEFMDFSDEYGRQRIFRGTNLVIKGPPYLPYREGFDREVSLVKRDYELMKKSGLNLIRLGVMWVGAQPIDRSSWNETYFSQTAELIDEAKEHGIFVLADMHQDCYAEAFCGEGMPAWASKTNHYELEDTVAKNRNSGNIIEKTLSSVENQVNKNIFTDYLDKFPRPVYPEFTEFQNFTNPFYFNGVIPYRKDCGALDNHLGNVQASYAAEATGQAFQNLYQNGDGLTDAWAAFFKKVTEITKPRDNVLGLELLNEPFAGNIYTNPMLAIPRFADAWNLQPAYDVVAKAIREVDEEELIFFAGVTWADMGDHVTYNGFSHPPGGHGYKDRSVMAYHYYMPPQETNSSANYYHNWVVPNAERLGTAQMMTEFDRGTPEQDFQQFERVGVSWAWWEWKSYCKNTESSKDDPSQFAAWGSCKTGYGGVFPPDNDKPVLGLYSKLVRMYPQAIQGVFIQSFYNVTNFQLDFEFTLDPEICAPTELYIGSVYDTGEYSAVEVKKTLPHVYDSAFFHRKTDKREENKDRQIEERLVDAIFENEDVFRMPLDVVHENLVNSEAGQRPDASQRETGSTETETSRPKASTTTAGELVVHVSPQGALKNEGVKDLILSLRAADGVPKNTIVKMRIQRRFFVDKKEIDESTAAQELMQDAVLLSTAPGPSSSFMKATSSRARHHDDQGNSLTSRAPQREQVLSPDFFKPSRPTALDRQKLRDVLTDEAWRFFRQAARDERFPPVLRENHDMPTTASERLWDATNILGTKGTTPPSAEYELEVYN